MTETPQQTNTRVYEILDEIRRDLGDVKTDVAVLASGQPTIVNIVEDHETRIRELVAGKADKADVDALRLEVASVKNEQATNSWLPKLGWAILLAGSGGIVTFLLTQLINI